MVRATEVAFAWTPAQLVPLPNNAQHENPLGLLERVKDHT